MLKKLFISLKLENIKLMINRFPVAFVVMLGFACMLFILNNVDYLSDDTTNIISKTLFTFSLVFFLSLGVYLSTEDTKIDIMKRSLYQLFPMAFGILFYIFFKVEFTYYDNLIFYLLCLTGISMYVFFAPFLVRLFKKEVDNNLYYQYLYKIAIVFLFGFVLGFLLFVLGSLAILAVDLLFDLSGRWLNKFYINWAIFSLSIITPTICLMEIPTKNQVLDKKFTINNFFSFIIKYVLSTFFIIYFVILYTYSIKVLLNFGEWPKGEVCWLVIVFSIFAYIHYMLSYYFDDSIKIIKIIRKSIPFVVIPQIFMLFYSIYLRISQYDLTINRYFVVVFGVWLLIISLYFIFSKKKNLIAIPSIITLFIIIIGIGPWSVFSLPESRQMARLEANLTKAGILKDGKIYPLNEYSDIDQDLSGEIYSQIYYVCYNLNCKPIAEMFGKDLDKLGRWTIVDQVTNEIKVKAYYPSTATNQEPESTTLYISVENPGLFPIDTEGYDYIVQIGDTAKIPDIENDIIYKNLTVNIDIERFQLSVIKDNMIQENIYMQDLAMGGIYNLFESKYGAEYNEKYQSVGKDEMTFEYKGTKYEIKVLLDTINIPNPMVSDEGRSYYGYVSGYALIREINE